MAPLSSQAICLSISIDRGQVEECSIGFQDELEKSCAIGVGQDGVGSVA